MKWLSEKKKTQNMTTQISTLWWVVKQHVKLSWVATEFFSIDFSDMYFFW